LAVRDLVERHDRLDPDLDLDEDGRFKARGLKRRVDVEVKPRIVLSFQARTTLVDAALNGSTFFLSLFLRRRTLSF